jgi:ribosomal protein S18 acetylase RimI-like enzyme
METTWRIRSARWEDADTLVRFNCALARETEGRELDPERIGPGVRAVLRDETKGRYRVAEREGVVVGQLMLTFEWSDWRNGMFWWIQSVYVAPGCRGQGVFTALYRSVEREASESGEVCGIRLYMEHHNATARRTYLRLGMVAAGYEVLERDFTRAPSPDSGSAGLT